MPNQTFSRRSLLSASLAAPALLRAQFAPQGSPTKYEPNWDVIKRHPLPKWYDDAKLGIFIHWGLYSVPAFAPPSGELGSVDWSKWFYQNAYAEWYMNTYRLKDSPTQKHHREKYGANFDYLDFIPEFNREVQKWNPESWADIFAAAGAQYAVLTTKHHDGFTLWPSAVRNPYRKPEQQGSARDLVGELSKAVRAKGLKMGLYYSGGLDWSFEPGPIAQLGDLMKTVPQSEEYARYADAQWRELIARYEPAILWNDINYPKKGDLTGIFSEYFNKYPEGLVNNRFGVEFADFTTPEYAKMEAITPRKWETCRGLGFSFGYNRVEGPEQVIASDKLIHMFIDIVSKNGNLLLNIGPRPDGSISEIQLDRLRALGSWMKINSEAIYGSQPWIRAVSTTAGGEGVRFTKKNGAVYACVLAKPKGGTVTIHEVYAAEGSKVELLGTPGALAWKQKGTSLEVTLPEAPAQQYAYSLKITPTPYQLVKE